MLGVKLANLIGYLVNLDHLPSREGVKVKYLTISFDATLWRSTRFPLRNLLFNGIVFLVGLSTNLCNLQILLENSAGEPSRLALEAEETGNDKEQAIN